jgi:glycosyltransferase involved in cell wall biosynthesis
LNKILIFTAVYNAEETIAATIESVQNQTYSDFRYIIAINGGTDDSEDVVRRQAEKDDRILIHSSKANFQGSFMKILYWLWATKYDTGLEDYICFIDSDDTYESTFLEKMLGFAEGNALDLAMCGWDFVRPTETDRRVSDESKILSISDFGENLPLYDKFSSPVWNKIFSSRILVENITFFENEFAKLFRDGVFFYGADTCFNYMLFSRIEKIGILNESLYKYNILDTSASRKNFHPMRIIADRRLAEARFDFMKNIGIAITDTNRDFINSIYIKSSMNTIKMIIDSDISLENKMCYLYNIFHYPLMTDAFNL